jgi:rhamnosyltransferase
LDVRYAPRACAEHSHNYTIAQTRKRFWGEGAADARILKSPPRFWDLLKGFAGALCRDALFLKREGQLRRLGGALAFRWAQKRAYYLGRKSAFKEIGK